MNEEEPNPQSFSDIADLSWEPNNPYSYSFTESLLKLSYDVAKPFVKIYSSITGIPTGSCLTWLSITLLSYVRGYNKTNKDLLWKQAVLETGGFSSPMSNTDNNQFGMHLPSVRPTVTAHYRYNINEGSNVSIYTSVFDSVLDRMLWDQYNSIEPKSSAYIVDVVDHDYNENPATYPGLWESADMPTPPIVIFIYIAVLIAIILLIKKLLF